MAANREGIVVFSGVEVTVPGGERNVHLLAIFDPSQGTEKVNDFRAQVLITVEKRGSTESLAQFTVNDVIDKICENDGIALLAHCDSTSGVTSEMLGQQRIDIIQNPKLLGAEITNDDTASFFTGSDQVYKRKLATLKGSDSHSLAEIGRRATYSKVGPPLITALRQCMYDPDTRIRTNEVPEVRYPTIRKIEISAGFFTGQIFELHSGLNAILGGKGDGKSLIVEYLRFVFDQPSDILEIEKDHVLKSTNY